MLLNPFDVFSDTVFSDKIEHAGLTGKQIGKNRPTRPTDLVKLRSSDKKLSMPTNHNLTGMMLDVATLSKDAWKFKSIIKGYALETIHGTAILSNIGEGAILAQLLKMLGPEGLQTTLAVLSHMVESIRRKFDTMPEHITDLNPMKFGISDLLRAMGKIPNGNTFSRTEQTNARNYLKVQSMIEYAGITPTVKGKPIITLGPLISIIGTDVEPSLPFDDIPPSNEVISITVLPGEHIYQLMRKGIPWLNPQLLKYNSKQSYQFLTGLYLCQMQVNRRNKTGQEWITIGAIEQGSGVNTLCLSKELLRLKNLEKALNKLAQDGIIPGEVDPASGTIRAIYMLASGGKQLSTADAIRAKRVKICHPEALANGYKPLSYNELATANQQP